MVSEIVEGLFAPDLSLGEIGGQDVLVRIDCVVPDEEGHGEQHCSVQIIPVRKRPPQDGEQGEVALLELLASLNVRHTTDEGDIG
jgi:hypothetical protein